MPPHTYKTPCGWKMMKERPIIFSGPMVRAILDGRKTQTRRLIRLPEDVTEGPRYWTTPSGRPQAGYADPGVNYWTPSGNHIDPCPYGFSGDRLYVRETCSFGNGVVHANRVLYRADDEWLPPNGKWRPSIHMPRWASRLTLEVTGVRVERLQDISKEDATAEGFERVPALPIDPRDWFRNIWDRINAKRGPWDSDPWVWVVEFQQLPTEGTDS